MMKRFFACLLLFFFFFSLPSWAGNTKRVKVDTQKAGQFDTAAGGSKSAIADADLFLREDSADGFEKVYNTALEHYNYVWQKIESSSFFDSFPEKTADETITGAWTFGSSVVIGTPLDTVGPEIPIFERKIKNDADEEMVAYAKTMEMSDNADGSEGVIIREYMMVGGVLGMIFSTKAYSDAPFGSEAPVVGCRVRSDGAGMGVWGAAQWVDYDGTAWAVLY